jgi:hypothetical protein
MPFKSVRRLLVTSLLLCETSDVNAGIASLVRRWPQGKPISICFFGGAKEARAMIAQTASEWTERINLSFDFGQIPNFNSCSRPDKSETLGMEPCRGVQEIGRHYPVGEFR